MLVENALHEMISANEPAVRRMLGYSVERGVNGGADGTSRTAKPSQRVDRDCVAAGPRARCTGRTGHTGKRLALTIGTESMVVSKDVLQLDEAAAGEVRQWAIRALVEAALQDETA